VAAGVDQVIEHLPSKLEALSSNPIPSPTHTQKNEEGQRSTGTEVKLSEQTTFSNL
jgi:hypothetical protein